MWFWSIYWFNKELFWFSFFRTFSRGLKTELFFEPSEIVQGNLKSQSKKVLCEPKYPKVTLNNVLQCTMGKNGETSKAMSRGQWLRHCPLPGWAARPPGEPKWGRKWEKFEEKIRKNDQNLGKKWGKWNPYPPGTVRLATALAGGKMAKIKQNKGHFTCLQWYHKDFHKYYKKLVQGHPSISGSLQEKTQGRIHVWSESAQAPPFDR